MRKTIGIVVVGCALGMIGVGCSSSSSDSSSGSGSAPDFASISNQFNQPSGTLKAESAGTAVNGYSEPNKSSSVTGALGGLSSEASLHPANVDPMAGGFMAACSQKLTEELQKKAQQAQSGGGNQAQVSASVSGCDCGGGGTANMSINASAQKGADGKTSGSLVYKTELNKCANDGNTISGSLFFSAVFSTDTAGSTSNFNGAMIYVIDLTVEGTNAGHYTLKYAQKGDKKFYLVKVDDGDVAISTERGWDDAKKTGTVTVVAKNGTWTCTLVEGKGTCKSDKNETFEVKG